MQVPEQEIARAAILLKAGGLVVYPTETLYGLAADATNQQALERLVRVKGREQGKPIAVLVSDLAMVSRLAEDLPESARQLAQRFWPGPLTLVLRPLPGLSPILLGAGGGIGMRISSHSVATELVRRAGFPITSPSANPAGAIPPRDCAAARQYFLEDVDAYLDAGTLPGEPASTVLDVRDGAHVVREGAISRRQLAEVLPHCS